MSDLIIANYGESVIPTNASIIIQSTESIESAITDGNPISDEPGAEFAYIDILVKNLRFMKSVYTVKNVTLRLRHLLDHTLRSQRLEPPGIPIAGDTSIADEYLQLYWQRSGIMASSQWVCRLECNYIRAFINTYY